MTDESLSLREAANSCGNGLTVLEVSLPRRLDRGQEASGQ